jgi:hypothetical protein
LAYDENLAARIRVALRGRAGIEERKMFGGVAFLLDGRMFCGVVKDALMVRVGRERHDEALQHPFVRPMDFTGRPMRGIGSPMNPIAYTPGIDRAHPPVILFAFERAGAPAEVAMERWWPSQTVTKQEQFILKRLEKKRNRGDVKTSRRFVVNARPLGPRPGLSYDCAGALAERRPSVTFDEFMAEIEAEARAEGLEAVAQLEALSERFRRDAEALLRRRTKAARSEDPLHERDAGDGGGEER